MRLRKESFKVWWQHMKCIRSKSLGHSFRHEEEKWNELRMGATVLHVKLIMKIMTYLNASIFAVRPTPIPILMMYNVSHSLFMLWTHRQRFLHFIETIKYRKLSSPDFFSLQRSHAWERLGIFRFSHAAPATRDWKTNEKQHMHTNDMIW